MNILILLNTEDAFEYIESMLNKLAYNIIGICSNKKYNNYINYSLDNINNLNYDIIISDLKLIYITDIINKYQLKNIYDMYWLLKQLLIKKYENCNDQEILNILEYWKTNDISTFNQYINSNTFNEVYTNESLPYIIYKINNKYRKIYYPKDYDKFIYYNDKYWIHNFLTEQLPTSPHLYITKRHKVNKNDIIIDAGVCEGNFAIKYVDICSKLYLIESDEMWIEPLKLTFKNYSKKIELINKFLSNKDENNNITIDNIFFNIKDKNIFLKMDIEGTEPLALLGAKNTLMNNKVNASICTYHNENDLIIIKSILEQYNFHFSTSKGYMLFLSDINIFKTLDFRKGILYASNYLNSN